MTKTLIKPKDLIQIKITARHGFVAPPGWLLLSVDYSSQEIFIAAKESGDPAMLRCFAPDDEVADKIPVLTEGGSILLKDGQPVMVKNPEKDLHTQTSASCCHPELFVGQPAYKWVEIAKDGSLIKKNGCSRDFAKRV